MSHCQLSASQAANNHRYIRLYKQYLSKPEWISAVRNAQAIFIAAHSQGCIVATQVVSRMIAQGHIRTKTNSEAVARCEWAFGPATAPPHAKRGNSNGSQPEIVLPKVLLLAMCGVHLGPFYNRTAETVMAPYLWFEHPAAR